MCSGDLPSECACVCVAFLLTAHFAFKGHLVIGAARGASCGCECAPTLTFVAAAGFQTWMPRLTRVAAWNGTHQWQQQAAAAAAAAAGATGSRCRCRM